MIASVPFTILKAPVSSGDDAVSGDGVVVEDVTSKAGEESSETEATSIESFNDLLHGIRVEDETPSPLASNRKSSRRNSSCLRPKDLSKEIKEKILDTSEDIYLKSKIENSFTTVNKLQFQNLGLYGRDEEMKILNDCLERIHQLGGRKLILINGRSGTGKTKLASHLTRQIQKFNNGLYVKGKFNLHQNKPYEGLAGCCQEICGVILGLQSSSPSRFEDIRESMLKELGAGEIKVLINVIPDLREIIGDEETLNGLCRFGEYDGSQSGHQLEQAQTRFHYATRLFFRLVVSYFAPLVLSLDDLQWSDIASLDLLEVLLTDLSNSRLLVVGTYRSNEKGRSLSRFIDDLEDKKQKYDIEIANISIGNLQVSRVSDILMDLLSIHDESSKIQDLAELCHKRTDGNAFFLVTFISLLKEEGLLKYDIGLMKWKWDIQTIESNTTATDNVVHMMKLKMKKLPSEMGEILSIAACLGSSYNVATLQLVWDRIQQSNNNITSYHDHGLILDVAIKYGFLEKQNDSSDCQFIHDNIQEAALSLTNPEKLRSIQSQIGMILAEELTNERLEEEIFVVVNLLNKGSNLQDDDDGTGVEKLEYSYRVWLAELRLQATRKAISLSAFESAHTHAKKGLDLLPNDGWNTHYELALNLYSVATESAGFLGDVDTVERYCKEVTNQKKCSLLEKLPVYNVLLDNMTQTGRNKEAVELSVAILKEMGCHFPKTKLARLFSIVKGLKNLKGLVKSKIPEDVSDMDISMMSDEMQIQTLRMLHQLGVGAYLSGCKDYLALEMFRGIDITTENGICKYSPAFYAGAGFFATALLGDLQGGSRLAVYALQLVEKLQTKTFFAKVVYVANGFLLPWTRPIRSSFKPLLEGYQVGMSVGETQSSMWCLYFYICLGFQAGRPLDRLEADCNAYSKQMKELKREASVDFLSIHWQMILNLMGRGSFDHNNILQGDNLADMERIEKEPLLGALYKTQQSRLFAIFGDHSAGADLALGLSRNQLLSKVSTANPIFMGDVFTRGISLFEMARKGHKRYAKSAKQCRRLIKNWVRHGAPNVLHYEALLDAENAALKRKLKIADTYFQSAIISASRGGFTHDAALASERYGEFLLEEKQDKSEATYRFIEAIKQYSEWGASRKVKSLHQKYQDLLIPKSL